MIGFAARFVIGFAARFVIGFASVLLRRLGLWRRFVLRALRVGAI